MGKAKTASKNNPTTREKAKEFFFKGKKVKPFLFISESTKYMAAQYEDGTPIEDAEGNPVAWDAVHND